MQLDTPGQERRHRQRLRMTRRRFIGLLAAAHMPTNPSFVDQAAAAPQVVFIPGLHVVGDATPLALGGIAKGIVAAGFDSVDNEIDIVLVDSANSDIYWGEATPGLAQATAMTSTFVGTFDGVNAVFDGASLQIAARLSGGNKFQYARLSRAGASEQAPVDTFTDADVPDLYDFDLAYGPGGLYWAWQAATSGKLKFARTSLTGAVLQSTVQVGPTQPFAHFYFRPRLGVYADGSAILVYEDSDNGATILVNYYLLDRNGVVRKGPVTLVTATTPYMIPWKVIVDTQNNTHIFLWKASASEAQRDLMYLRLDKDWNVVTPVKTLLSNMTSIVGNELGGGCYDPVREDFYVLQQKLLAGTYYVNVIKMSLLDLYQQGQSVRA